jgi:hypothetical protein
MSFQIPKIRRCFPFQRPMVRQINAIADILNKGAAMNGPGITFERRPDGRLFPKVQNIAAATASVALAPPPEPDPTITPANPFTEFYCQSGGSNLNAGSTNSNTAAYTSTNGSWNSVTNIFTPTDGSTPSNSVNVGDYASVFLDAATTGVYVARITNVAGGVNGAITLSTTIHAGTTPSTSATGRSIKVGGAWKGPNGTDGSIAFKALIGTLRPTLSDTVRINCKNDAVYSITAAIGSQAGSVSLVIQGYSSTPGDGGIAILDGGTTGASYALWDVNGGVSIIDFEFRNNGASGSASGITAGMAGGFFYRCIFHDFMGSGLDFTGATGPASLISCEAYACNKSNTAAHGGFKAAQSTTAPTGFSYCTAHDNAGSNAFGFRIFNSNVAFSCTADSNGGHGFEFNAISSPRHQMTMIQCDSIDNGGAGAKSLSSSSQDTLWFIKDCNFTSNTGYGIDGGAAQNINGFITNCTFSSNGLGNTNHLGQTFITP